MKELGVQMIPAYSPQARGRSERSFGTWQTRLPNELRLAKIDSLEGANAFLGERYIAEFNSKFAVVAPQPGTAFRKCGRRDLDWVFSVQTERVVDNDNTVAIGDCHWQLEKSRFRNSLAGCTVTIHQHLDERVSIRFGPHMVGRYTAAGQMCSTNPRRQQTQSRGKDGPVDCSYWHHRRLPRLRRAACGAPARASRSVSPSRKP
jgi:hypothetical protein